jgi:hypothetical protein
MILEAVYASRELPERVRKRARIIMMAGNGRPNSEIAEEVRMARPRVLHWRKRFEEGGIRGLWDSERVPPQKRVAEDVEQAIVHDRLHVPRNSLWGEWERSNRWEKGSKWNVRNMASRYGVSRSSVQRIWKRHGIEIDSQSRPHQFEIIHLDQLKISQDPLFAISVYGIGGLFYESVGIAALAFCSSTRPFSSLTFSSIDAYDWEEIADDFLTQFRKLWRSNFKDLAKRTFGSAGPPAFLQFVHAILEKPQHADAQIHLLIARRELLGVDGLATVRERLDGQPRIHLHYAPCLLNDQSISDEPGSLRDSPDFRWADLVKHWLDVINAWPMQASFVESINQMRTILRELPIDGPPRHPLVIK